MRIENSRQLASFAKEVRQENERECQFDVTVFVDAIPHGAGSLLLQVNPSGKMNFRYMQRYLGKREFINIGTYSDTGMSLIEAQEKARQYGELASQLKSTCSLKSHFKQLKLASVIELKDQNNTGSVEDLINDYSQAMKRNGKRTYEPVKKQLLLNFSDYLDMNANTITSYEISKILASLIDRGAIVQANRVRSYAHAMFAFAIRFDNDPLYINRSKKYKILTNPVSCVPRQNHAENVRDRVLNNEEVQSLLAACKHNVFSAKVGYLIRLLLLLGGQRPNELLASKWSDFDLGNDLWNLPCSLTKNKKAHVVPITPFAKKFLLELHQLTGEGEFLFPQKCGLKQMTTQALSQAFRKYCDDNEIAYFQPRDIRRTVKTKLGERGISKQVRDKVQNHIANDVSTKHYDRYDYLEEKKSALIAWGEWLLALGI